MVGGKIGGAFVGLGEMQTVCNVAAVPGRFLPTYLRRRWLGTGAQSPGRSCAKRARVECAW